MFRCISTIPTSCFAVLTSVQQVQPVKNTGKSCWKGRDDKVVTVEEFSLQHYEDEGWKGCVAFSPRLGFTHDMTYTIDCIRKGGSSTPFSGSCSGI
jgi:hypothetical protein